VRPLLLWIIICRCLQAYAVEQSFNDSPLDIGKRVEMLVDDRLIDSARTHDASLKLHTPLRREIVLTTDKPWEGIFSAYFTVFQDGPRYRMYYRGSGPVGDSSERQFTCLAESSDGIRFDRPNLGLHEFDGSKDNNIVLAGVESHNIAPFLDTNPAAKPDARYKALGGIASKLFAFASADGIHWRKMQAAPVMTEGTFDSLNVAFWDPSAKCYRCYSRYFDQGLYKGIRCIQSSRSDDFIHWAKPEANAYAEEVPSEHFYTNATSPCPGAPHHYLSFPMRFLPDRKKVAEMKEPGVSDAVFMTSRNGQQWDRSFLEAWLRPGPDERNWTHRSNMPAWGIVQTSPDEFSMYVSEHYGWPDNRLRRITIRRNGFASMHAGAAGGEFTTKPLTFSGKNLILNYATSAAGSVRVELQDSHGKTMPGYALNDAEHLFGDELDAVVKWSSGGDLASLIGKPVRLHFVLRDADIFAIRTAAESKPFPAGSAQ
jgi:hypothetical protein